MVRFLHTADWQLGMRATGLGEKAGKVREARTSTVATVAELATERNVDFLLLAGDAFEDNAVDRRTVCEAAQALEKMAPIPVFIIPGNHDPYTPDSVYNRPSWTSEMPENVRVLPEQKPVALEKHDVVLFPCPLTQKQSSSSPTTWIAGSDYDSGDAIRVGLAHGSLDIHEKNYNFPIPADSATQADLDYLALGDWHGTYIHDPHTAYSGTPEQTDFGEENAGNVLLVEIQEKGVKPSVEPLQVGQLSWLTWEEEISEATVDALRERIRDIDAPDKTLLRLSVRGSVKHETLKTVQALRDSATVRLLHFSLDDDSLGLMLEGEDVRESLPPGALQEVCDVLLSLRSDQQAGEEAKLALESLPDGTSIEDDVTERALQILCNVSRSSE